MARVSRCLKPQKLLSTILISIGIVGLALNKAGGPEAAGNVNYERRQHQKQLCRYVLWNNTYP